MFGAENKVCELICVHPALHWLDQNKKWVEVWAEGRGVADAEEGGCLFKKQSLQEQERSYCKLKPHLSGEPVVMSHQGVWDSSHRPWQHSFMTGMWAWMTPTEVPLDLDNKQLK